MASHNKSAIVTGAGTGIGKAVALALLRDGYHVALAGRRKEPLAAVVAEAGDAGSRALAVPCDVSDPAQVRALFAKARDAFGRLDLLFNNAGINAPGIPLEDLSVEQWRSVVDINLSGVFRAADGSSTMDRSPRTRHVPTRRPTPPPSTPSRGSPNQLRSTDGSTTSPAVRSTSEMPRPRWRREWRKACRRPMARSRSSRSWTSSM